MNYTSLHFTELERGVRAALETYSNVHRGSGHNSMVTTHLFEQSRGIVLEHLGLNKHKYTVVFCTPARASALKANLKQGSYFIVSSRDIGLCLGVTAVAVKRKALPKGAPFQAGGGTARLIGPGWVLWAKGPDKLEAGTPAIINIIAFARALTMIRQNNQLSFRDQPGEKSSVKDILYRDALEGFTGRELMDRLRQTLIGREVLVPTTEGARPFINLDNAASTPTFDPVWEAVCRTWKQNLQIQQNVIDEVRSICSGFLGAPKEGYDLIFTSNATEAINLAAERLSRESLPETETVVLTTLLEHSSNDLPWRLHPGFSLIRIKVNDEGMVNPNELERVMREYNQEGRYGNKRIRLMAVSGASNVLGNFNNLEEISSIVHRFGARLLVDAAQMVAHRKVAVSATGIDYLAFSAHKVYAPFGSGALVVRKGLPGFGPLETESIRSSGEENAAGIAALGKALILLQRMGLDHIMEEEQALTRHALLGLSQIHGIKIYGIKDPDSGRFSRKGGVVPFELKGMIATRIAKELAMQGGIGVRAGCHCAHLIIKHLLRFTPVLERIQRTIVILFPMLVLPGLLRVSFGIENTREDIDTLLSVLQNIASKRKKNSKTTVKQQMKEFTETASIKVYS